jgi:DNA-binding NarL/FixJ family response regulator
MQPQAFVLIVEDHPLYKQALVSLMRISFPEALVEATGSGEDAIVFLSSRKPGVLAKSVVMLDLSLPGLSGLEMVDRIHGEYPDVRLIVISGSDDVLRVGACLGAGAAAFVSKTTPPDLIVELVGRAMRGQLTRQEWLTVEGNKELDGLQRVHLTSRQLEVLGLICQGMTNKQIADKLEIIEATAKAHVSAIFKELGVVSRTQALLVAQRLGLRDQPT